MGYDCQGLWLLVTQFYRQRGKQNHVREDKFMDEDACPAVVIPHPGNPVVTVDMVLAVICALCFRRYYNPVLPGGRKSRLPFL